MTQEVKPKPLFPKDFKDNDGNPRILINEMCKCKHYRTQHWSRCVVAIGHGPCSQCECERFTWVGGVYGGVQPDVDEFISNIGPSVPFGILEIDRLNESIAEIEDEKQRLIMDANESSQAERAAISREGDLRVNNVALEDKVKKLEKELKKFLDPFVVAKGERRSILLEPPNDGNKHA